MKTKIMSLALVGLIALPGIAAAFPALATEDDGDVFDMPATVVQQQLAENGIHATRVEQWGQYIEAFVRNKDGSTSIVIVDPDTMQRVG